MNGGFGFPSRRFCQTQGPGVKGSSRSDVRSRERWFADRVVRSSPARRRSGFRGQVMPRPGESQVDATNRGDDDVRRELGVREHVDVWELVLDEPPEVAADIALDEEDAR